MCGAKNKIENEWSCSKNCSKSVPSVQRHGTSILFPAHSALHHCLVLLGKPLAEPLAGLEELVHASVDAGLFLGGDRFGGEVVDAVIETSVCARIEQPVAAPNDTGTDLWTKLEYI